MIALQHSCHALARHARIRFQRKTFAREGVHHTEYTQPSPACRHIAGEINRPFLIRCCQDRAAKRKLRVSRLRRMRRTQSPAARYTRCTRL